MFKWLTDVSNPVQRNSEIPHPLFSLLSLIILTSSPAGQRPTRSTRVLADLLDTTSDFWKTAQYEQPPSRLPQKLQVATATQKSLPEALRYITVCARSYHIVREVLRVGRMIKVNIRYIVFHLRIYCT